MSWSVLKQPRGNNKAVATKAARGHKASANLAEAASRGCAACPLDKAPLTHPKIPPSGSARPTVYVIGEAPGETEDERGEQFVGAAGKVLRAEIPKSAEGLRFNNVIRCRPPGNREPSPLEVACCRAQQEADIAKSKPRLIAGFGGVALSWLLPSIDKKKLKINAWRGRLLPMRIRGHDCWFMPHLHPSYVMRTQHTGKGDVTTEIFKRDMARMFALVKRLPGPLIEDPKDKDVGVVLLRDVDKIVQALEEAKSWERYGIDLETNGVRPFRKDPKILTCSVSNYDKTYAFPLDHPEAVWRGKDRSRLLDALESLLLEGGEPVAHNSKFEQEWLAVYFGPRIIHKVAWQDTMAQAFVLDEREGAKSLEAVSLIQLGLDVKALSPPMNMEALDCEPLSRVLPYNAYDAKYVYPIFYLQAEQIEKARLTSVYDMMNDRAGPLALAQIAGVKPDTAMAARLASEYTEKIRNTEQQIQRNKDVRAFVREHGAFLSTSPKQLLQLFYHQLGHKECEVRVRKGRKGETKLSTDESVLSTIDHPVAALILELREYDKLLGTYIQPLLEGGKYIWADGLVHTNFNHLLTRTGRTCVVKGTPVEICRDLLARPSVPIEEVKVGDWAYCYDDELKLSLRRVIWVGKTGTKRVVRVRWRSDGGQVNGHVDLTPEHRVRLITGKWKAAGKLDIGDRVLSLGRWTLNGVSDSLCPTGTGAIALPEAHFVWETVNGRKRRKKHHIHHRDGNHYNNHPDNLVEISSGEHTRHHNLCGSRRYDCLGFSKFTVLRMLAKTRGRWTTASEYKWSLSVYCRVYGIDIKHVSRRYSKHGIYCSSGAARKAVAERGVTKAMRLFGTRDYYVWLRLLSEYGITYTRLNKKYGSYEPQIWNNHVIVSVERMPVAVPVYDLEVEDFHNFIGGGICLHNSSDSPNLQNQPNRGDGRVARRIITAFKDQWFVATDYGQIEARVIAMASRCPVMTKAMWEGYDIHGEWAARIAAAYPRIVGGKAKLQDKQVMKTFRNEVKNKWTFPLLYGSVLEAVSDGLQIPSNVLAPLHEEFWLMFDAVRVWQEGLRKSYRRTGYVEALTGRRRHGPLGANEIINTPIQGTASDIVVEAGSRLSRRAYDEDRPQLQYRLNVHDDLSFYIPDKTLEDDIADIAREMVSIPPAYSSFITVPLVAEIKVGRNWCDLEEIGTVSSIEYGHKQSKH